MPAIPVQGIRNLLNEDMCTAEIIKGHIGRCSSFRIPDHVRVDGVRYTVDAVGFGAYNCPHTLKHLIIPDSITYLDEDCFCHLPNLRSVHIGKGLKYIQNWHFRGCPGLRHFEIDRYNPYMKKLEAIDFPSTLESLGWETMTGCHRLKTIILRSDSMINMDKLSDDFETVDIERCTLYVPPHLVESYRNHPQWGLFKRIKQIDTI